MSNHDVYIFTFAAVSAIDTTGVTLIRDLRKAVEKKGIEASENRRKLLRFFSKLLFIFFTSLLVS